MVEQYRLNQPPQPLPRNINSLGASGGATSAPPQQQPVAEANGPSTSAAGPAGRMASQPGMTYAALQQQQEKEAAAAALQRKAAARQQRQSASGEGGDSSGGAGSAPAGPAPAQLPIPSFYAAAPAGPATQATAPGSLLSLLTTALRECRCHACTGEGGGTCFRHPKG